MSFIAEPGLVRHAGVRPTLSFGEWNGESTARVTALKAAFDECKGLSASVSTDIQLELWEKFLFIAPFSAVGAVTRKPAGLWRDVPETRALLRLAMEEVVSLANARGVEVRPDAVDKTLAFTDRLPAEATASMQRDLLEGRPSELEAQTGAIVRLARLADVPVPANAFLYASLRPAELHNRGR
jgi:2-dehydropantoate 2-reductase